MSLRSRKRRQNRVHISTPATRTTRLVLERPARGLRLFNRVQSPAMPRTTTVIQSEFNPFYAGFNRDVRHLLAHREYRKLEKSEPVKKPLSSIALDGTIITDLPRNHPICVLRRERRELMFATGKAGVFGQRRRKSGEILRCE